MTRAEAEAIVALLKSGKRFATRFQEEEWGVEARGDGTFRKWARVGRPDGVLESEDILSESAAVALFVHYTFARIRRMVW